MDFVVSANGTVYYGGFVQLLFTFFRLFLHVVLLLTATYRKLLFAVPKLGFTISLSGFTPRAHVLYHSIRARLPQVVLREKAIDGVMATV